MCWSRWNSTTILARLEGHAEGDRFPGTGDKPVALSEAEVSSIIFRSETAKDKPRLKIKFEKNEQVRITDGPFANFNGVVDEINEDRETLKVMVTIFGRSTPVELEFGKVEKIE